jgi:hypothetical protein
VEPSHTPISDQLDKLGKLGTGQDIEGSFDDTLYQDYLLPQLADCLGQFPLAREQL